MEAEVYKMESIYINRYRIETLAGTNEILEICNRLMQSLIHVSLSFLKRKKTLNPPNSVKFGNWYTLFLT
jgi:hypothetical protein